jgi:hypothetical protein
MHNRIWDQHGRHSTVVLKANYSALPVQKPEGHLVPGNRRDAVAQAAWNSGREPIKFLFQTAQMFSSAS